MNTRIHQLFKEIQDRLQELEGLVKHHAPSDYALTELLTPKERIRGLNGKILGVIRDNVEPISSAEITKRLYSPTYGVSYEGFARKVIVSISYMHKNGHRVALSKDGQGKALWSLPKSPYDNTIPSKGWDKLKKPEKEGMIA